MIRAGFRLHHFELRNWGTFNGDHHYQLAIDGNDSCFTGLNGSGKSTAMDGLLTLLVPHEIRHYNVAATGAGAKRERSIKTYILGAFSKEESPESAAGQTKFLRKPGVLTILLAAFRDEVFDKWVTLAQIHWVTPAGDHQSRFLIAEKKAHIEDLGIANLSVASFKTHFDKNGWFYETSQAPYTGKLMSLLRIPSDEALRLLCRAISLKDVPSVTEFVRTLMLEPQDTAAYLAGIEKHFQDLAHIYDELQATKAEIDWLVPIEELYTTYKTAADEVLRLGNVRKAAVAILTREAGALLDVEINSLVSKIETHKAEAERLRQVIADTDQRILDLKVSLKTNDTYAAIERLKGEEEKLVGELAQARERRETLTRWLHALGYKETISTEQAFTKLVRFANQSTSDNTNRQERLLEDRGAKLQEVRSLRAQAQQIAEDINELGNKRTKIPRHIRAMRDEICQELGVSEGLLPFVGELLDVPPNESEWRSTIEVLLHGFALSVVVPDDLYPQVAGYVEHSEFRNRFVYYRAGRNAGVNVTLNSDRVYGKLQIRPDAWCRTWLQQALMHDFDHRCCETIDIFKSERGRAVTRNMHVKGGDRSFKESKFAQRDFDILGWTNESKIEELKRRLAQVQAQAQEADKAANNLQQEANSIRGGLLLCRQIIELPGYRSIDDETIGIELTSARDRRSELEAQVENDEKLKELTAQLKEAEAEKTTNTALRDTEVSSAASLDEKLTQRRDLRKTFAGRFNSAAADFDWNAWAVDVATIRGDKPLVLVGIENQITEVLSKIDGQSSSASRTMAAAERDIGPKMAVFLEGTSSRGYKADWSAAVSSAPAMIAHLNKLRNEKFHVQERDFKEQMDRMLEEDIDFAKHELRGKQKANHERIRELNNTLKSVDYNEGTFVEIVSREATDQAVATFQAKIEECTRQVLGMTPEQRFARFKAVKDLITYIREHRLEAERGANPNNWDTYALKERSRANPADPGIWHGDSDGNSGGQKAKLACTIVAAAMAFRMNHTKAKDSTAFRLVMIDEIFSKSDDVNSAYALRVFEQFDFQLLLVTPRDGRLKLVIPYVGSFHLFQNPTRDNSTVVSITGAQAAAAASREDELDEQSAEVA